MAILLEGVDERIKSNTMSIATRSASETLGLTAKGSAISTSDQVMRLSHINFDNTQ